MNLYTHKAVKNMGVYFLRVPWLVTLFLFYLDLLFPFPLFSLSSSSLLPCLAVFDHGGFLSGIWVLGVRFPEFRPSELTVGPFPSCYCSRQKSSSFIYYSQIGQLGFTVGTCWLFWSFLFPVPLARSFPSFLLSSGTVRVLQVYVICTKPFVFWNSGGYFLT